MGLWRRKAGIVLILCLCGLAGAANAIPALTGWTGGRLDSAGGPQLWGWAFSVSQTIDVTALGAYDDYGNGFNEEAHDVGIFRMSDQSLVASLTIPRGVGGFLENSFRYYWLPSPVTLSIGDYEILEVMQGGTTDIQVDLASNATTADGITLLHSVFNDATHLMYLPAIFGAYEQGFFGPNFQFEPSAIPEPNAVALLGLGLAGIGFSRRKQ